MKRFFDKIRISETGCWNWIASIRGKSGYGAFKLNGLVVDAHRVSWMIHKGEIQKGKFVCHTCDNRLCVNPDHLFLGTQEDNMQDCVNKGRLVTPIGIQFEKGYKPPNRSLPDDKIKIVKNAISQRGDKSLKQVAKDLGVKYQLIRDVNSQRAYK